MLRSKIKGEGMNGPDIPDSGSRKNTPITYQMSNTRKEKIDINDIEYELGDDPKADRSEVRERRTPKFSIGMASDVVPLPEDLEPTTRRGMKTQNIKMDVGAESQIKIRPLGSKSRRKVSIIPTTELGDTSHRDIAAPKLVDTKRTPVKGANVDISDMRDVQILGRPVNTVKSKTVTRGDHNVQTYVDQTVQIPHNPLRVKKVNQVMTFAESSGFRCDFNPSVSAHRSKLKKVIEKYKVVIDQDPEVALTVLSKINFKTKQKANPSTLQPEKDHDATEVHSKLSQKSLKKTSQWRNDVEMFDHTDLKKDSKSKSRRRHGDTVLSHVETHNNVGIEDRRSRKVSKKTSSKVEPDDEDREQVDFRDVRARPKQNNNARAAIDIPEDGKFVPLGSLKSVSRGKKTTTRLAVHVTPFEGEVSISSKPHDMTEKKGKADVTGLEQSPTGVEVQVERRAKSKSVKQPDTIDLQLGPDDKQTDGDIVQALVKNRQAKPSLPNFEPSLNDQDVEIEKTKNVLIFT